MPKSDESPEVIEGDAEEMSIAEEMDEIKANAPRVELTKTFVQPASVAPQVQAAELVQRMNVIREAAAQAMEEGVDYGKVPGTDKDTLFKPGSEKLGVLFRLDVQPENEKRWEEDGHLTVISKATVYDAPTGARLGSGEGICSTRERKYAKRMANRKCPVCGAEAIIKGKAEYGGGLICFKKKGGCGEKWNEATSESQYQEIMAQPVGEIDNPDLPDLWNTVDKMASKRARVDAVLAVTGASAIFTQDLAEEGETPVTSDPGFPLATDEQKAELRACLEYLFPPDEAKPLWGQIKASFGGELYAPAAQAVCAVIDTHKGRIDAERTEAQEALNAERDASDG